MNYLLVSFSVMHENFVTLKFSKVTLIYLMQTNVLSDVGRKDLLLLVLSQELLDFSSKNLFALNVIAFDL